MRLWYRFCRALCLIGFFGYFRGRARHLERVPAAGGALLVCNHQSYLDPVLAGVSLHRECHFMARDTLFRGLFKRLIESLNAYPVKRGTSDVGAIKETLRRLKAGGIVVVFPESTRTSDGEIAPMQTGVVLLARKTGVPLIPCLIDGAFEAWPRTAKLPRPRKIIVAYGEPVHLAALGDMTDEQCIELIRRRIIALRTEFGQSPNARQLAS